MHAAALPDHAQCEQARLARDARFDGLFYAAVRTTGIHCRPVRPAPPAHRRNVQYYPSAAAAAAAGYRPCLRCRPELAPAASAAHEPVLRQALDLVNQAFVQAHSSSELAAEVDLGVRQLQRIFVRQLGATAHQLHRNNRLLLAKQLLTETGLGITEVADTAGYNSVRRFNAAFANACRMTPSAMRTQAAAPDCGQPVLRLAYRPPLDFAALLAFLARRSLPSIGHVDVHSYRRVLVINGKASVIAVRASRQRHALLLALGDTVPAAIPAIVARVRQLFDLDADLATVHHCLPAEPLLAQAIATRPGLRIPGGWDGVEVAVRAVLGQQVSVAAATPLAQRLLDAHGPPLAGMPVGLERRFPTPAQLAQAPLEQIGLPHSRADTLRALAAACATGQLYFSRAQPLAPFIARITALPGIGTWTAHCIALRAFGQPDAFPAGDRALQQVLGEGKRLSQTQTGQRSQRWRPWRAYAVLHRWQLAAPSPTQFSRSSS